MGGALLGPRSCSGVRRLAAGQRSSPRLSPLRGGSLEVMANRLRRAPVSALGLALVAALLALSVPARQADAYQLQYCSQIPVVGGIPPWGFHTGPPLTAANGSFARGHGQISLTANTVSGILCQVDRSRGRDRLIVMTVEHHLLYHSHYAVLWGYPGNIMVVNVKVRSSNDPRCRVGTVGRLTLFASYNGVRSDSVRFSFPRACAPHDHLYHGSQVNNQVPPL